jgi:arylsulfotransferase ASST/YHYH protein
VAVARRTASRRRSIATLSAAALAAVAIHGGTSARASSTRLGDGLVTNTEPRKGWAYACSKIRRTTGGALPWISGKTYDPARKPLVDTSIRWPRATFAIRRRGNARSFLGNGLPVGDATGSFPPRPADDAASYARNAPALAEQRVKGHISGTPERRHEASCLSASQPVAVALNGVPILPGFAPSGLDAAAREVHDACGGRTDRLGRYFYRAGMRCLTTGASRRAHSPQIGYARDGFPLFGPRGPGGRLLRSSGLDDCHGHTHAVRVGGREVETYHYHLTGDFPYTVGCFRARPSANWVRDLRLRISAPTLYPVFRSHISDYTVRCTQVDPMEVSVWSPPDTRVAVARGGGRSGRFTRAVQSSPGREFTFTVSSRGRSTTYHVRCLPADFPPWSAHRYQTPQAEWYVVTPGGPYVVVFDTHGVPVWWTSPAHPPIDASVLPSGRLLWARYAFFTTFGASPDGAYEEHSLDGRQLRTLQTVGSPTDFHDMRFLGNGNALMLSYKIRETTADLSPYGGPSDATVLDAVIQEITPGGSVVWSWNSKDHIDLAETGRYYRQGPFMPNPVQLDDGRKGYDLVHVNAVQPVGDDLLVSLRHTDAVYKIARSNGAVIWKLGGTATPKSLAIKGDPRAPRPPLGGQHDINRLPDGTVTLHDNGFLLNRPARALRFKIDERSRTATVVDEIVEPRAPYAICCGSARRLPGGNWVMSWGSTPLVTETTASGRRVFDLNIAGFSYRAFPVLPGTLSRAALRAGMDAMLASR